MTAAVRSLCSLLRQPLTYQIYIVRRTLNDLKPEQYHFVSQSYMKDCLVRSGASFQEGPTCLTTKCPMSSSHEHKSFINKISGLFTCHHCKIATNWKSLEEYLVSTKRDQIAISEHKSLVEGENEWNRMVKHLRPIGKVAKRDVDAVLAVCCLEDVSLDYLKSLDAYIDERSKEIYIPIRNELSVVGFKRIFEKCQEATFPTSSAAGIVRCASDGDSVVIVQSMSDFFALQSKENHRDLVCLPYGQQSLPQEILPLFENYKKIVLWFDNDITSWNNVRVFAKKLDEKRCFLIRPSENQPRPKEAKKLGLNLKKIIDNAQPISHASITTFAELREDVRSEVFNIDKISGVKWTRFDYLNSLMKGHRRGELTVITGPTGIGKTTFISEYSLDLAMSGVSTLWGSFEIRNQRLAKMMLQQFIQGPLNDLEKFNYWADSFERLPLYFMTYHGQQTLDLVMEAVEHATYVHDIAHVVIDNVQFMLGLSSKENAYIDRFYRQDALIAAFRTFATQNNVHVTLVIHPRKEREGELLTANSIFGGAKASQEADNILIIQQRSLPNLKSKKFLQVSKNRYSGDLGVHNLDFDKPSLCFSPKKKDPI